MPPPSHGTWTGSAVSRNTMAVNTSWDFWFWWKLDIFVVVSFNSVTRMLILIKELLFGGKKIPNSEETRDGWREKTEAEEKLRVLNGKLQVEKKKFKGENCLLSISRILIKCARILLENRQHSLQRTITLWSEPEHENQLRIKLHCPQVRSPLGKNTHTHSRSVFTSTAYNQGTVLFPRSTHPQRWHSYLSWPWWVCSEDRSIP